MPCNLQQSFPYRQDSRNLPFPLHSDEDIRYNVASGVLENPFESSPFFQPLASPAQAANITYSLIPHNPLVFGGHEFAMCEEGQAVSFEIPFQHRQYSVASDGYFELASYTEFLQPNLGDTPMLSGLSPLLEPVSWSLLYTNQTPPIPQLTDGEACLSSPASMGMTAATGSLDQSDASSPSDLATPFVPSSYVQ